MISYVVRVSDSVMTDVVDEPVNEVVEEAAVVDEPVNEVVEEATVVDEPVNEVVEEATGTDNEEAIDTSNNGSDGEDAEDPPKSNTSASDVESSALSHQLKIFPVVLAVLLVMVGLEIF